MSNPWTGRLAKSIISKKRSRTFWNSVFIAAIIIILLVMSTFVYQVACDRFTYDSEQIFVKYENDVIVTDADSFKIAENDKQEINISRLLQVVKTGDKMALTISKVTGELLEVKHLNNTVYKKEITPIMPTIIAGIFLVFPILCLLIFMLVVTNIKNPGKRIDKFQKKYLLRTYR